MHPISRVVVEAPPMSFWSCVFYVIANVIAWILYWQYQLQRARQQRAEETGGVPAAQDAATSAGRRQYKRRAGGGSSLLSLLGITYSGYSTFFTFEDRFTNFDDVAKACRRAGLESCGLIVGVDFSASNEWQGRKTFNGQNLHKVSHGKILNPYQKVISILGKTLESFDDDNLVPSYGFGDSTTKGKAVFSFSTSGDGGDFACKGWADVMEKYQQIASSVVLSGPTDFAPMIHKAVEIVKMVKKYHILILIADGQVTQHDTTVQAIVDASRHPLSIVMVGVGDGPWGVMEEFDNCLPERCFDNFQFVNYHGIRKQYRKNPESSFALHAMMEIPDQYKTIKSLGYLNSEACESPKDVLSNGGVKSKAENIDRDGVSPDTALRTRSTIGCGFPGHRPQD